MENSKTVFNQKVCRFALRFSLFSMAVLVIAWGIEAASYRNPNNGGNGGSLANHSSAEIKLGFFNADWSTVLNRVCEQSGSTLVMSEVPKGRFNRYDRNRYNRTQAVRILNRELEPKGFRLVEKGKFLDVLYLRSARSEYHRPELPRRSANSKQLSNNSPQNQPAKKRLPRVQTISTRRGSQNTTQQTNETQPRYASTPRELPANRVKSLLDIAQPKKRPVVIESNIIRVIHPQQKRAVDLARTIYNSLKGNAELIERGPGGLPAFRVLKQISAVHTAGNAQQLAGRPASRVKFSMGIDTGRNELVIDAPPTLNRNVSELVRYLDLTVLQPGEVTRLVPTSSDPAAIAKVLQPQLQLLAQNEPAKKPVVPPKKTEKVIPRQGGGLTAVIPIIRGRVTIRDVPGVGLVVTGNEKDVEAVLEIIRQLDAQGKFTTPNIDLHVLKHVNSLAMAELLTAVYQQLATIRTGGTQQTVGSVAFIPVIRPNAILILASELELIAILKLVDQLDKPVDPKKEYRVFRLRFGVASQVVANLDAMFQQQAGTGTGTANANTRGLSARVRAIADVRTNSVIVEAPPNDMAAVAHLIQKFDQERVGSVSRVRIIQLKNAISDELATLLTNAIQGVLYPVRFAGQQAGQGGVASSQGLRDSKASLLEFLSPAGTQKRLIRSGILSDIRITSNPRTNSLIVTAPETSMKLMEVLIKQLDQPSTLVAEIKVFALANGDATAMVTLLDALFTAQSQQQGQNTIQLAIADDASSGLVPLRFSVDARTNSIIAVGGAAALTVVEAVILRLDESDARQRKTSVIKLKNAPAADISTAINAFLQAQRDLANIDPNLVTNVELLEREIIVVPEPVSNSLLVSTTPRYEEEIIGLIKELDAAPPQVIIQALIVEVELDNTDEFGIELGFQDSMFFDRGVVSNLQTINSTITQPNGNQTTNQTIISQERTPGFNFNNNPLGNNSAANPTSIASQALSNFSLGRVNGDLGYGGLVLSASSSSISLLLRALAAKRTVHVLSRPQITTLDNQLAQIQVGQDIPIVTGVTTTATGSANPNISQRNVGIILTVTPRINSDGTIVMEVVAEKSSLAGQGVPIFTDANTGNVIESPIINITTARSTLAISNGQTVVMGGMIVESDDTIQRKVPWLGDIPFLGYAFRFDSTRKRRSELLIFLTPRVIRNDGDMEMIKQIEAERLHFIERDAEKLHGPLYAVPAPEQQNSNTPQPVNPQSSQRLPSFDDGNVPSTIVPSGGLQSPFGRQNSIQQTTRQVVGDSTRSVPTQKTQSRYSFFNPFKSKSR